MVSTARAAKKASAQEEVSVRPARRSDVDELYRLYLELLRAEDQAASKVARFMRVSRRRLPSFERNVKRDFLQKIAKRTIRVFAAMQGGRMVGYAIATLEPNDKIYFEHEPMAYLDAIAVLSSERAKGIGRLLHDAVIAWFKQHKIKYVYLEVFRTNPAVQMYEKLGYVTASLQMWKKL